MTDDLNDLDDPFEEHFPKLSPLMKDGVYQLEVTKTSTFTTKAGRLGLAVNFRHTSGKTAVAFIYDDVQFVWLVAACWGINGDGPKRPKQAFRTMVGITIWAKVVARNRQNLVVGFLLPKSPSKGTPPSGT